jgi:hypothetical protein
MADALSPEEFDQWEPVPAAYNRLGEIIGHSEIRAEILQRLSLGELLGSARRMAIEHASGERASGEYRVLPASLWKNAIITYDDNIWATGSHTFVSSPHSRHGQKVSCTGIRLDPAGLQQLLVDAGIDHKGAQQEEAESGAEVRKTRHGLPALRDSLLTEWHALFLKAYPNGAKSLAEQSASGMFPGHSVDRQKVRDLFPAAKRGRPPKNNDN